jgi:hypothetical protein
MDRAPVSVAHHEINGAIHFTQPLPFYQCIPLALWYLSVQLVYGLAKPAPACRSSRLIGFMQNEKPERTIAVLRFTSNARDRIVGWSMMVRIVGDRLGEQGKDVEVGDRLIPLPHGFMQQ